MHFLHKAGVDMRAERCAGCSEQRGHVTRKRKWVDVLQAKAGNVRRSAQAQRHYLTVASQNPAE